MHGGMWAATAHGLICSPFLNGGCYKTGTSTPVHPTGNRGVNFQVYHAFNCCFPGNVIESSLNIDEGIETGSLFQLVLFEISNKFVEGCFSEATLHVGELLVLFQSRD